MTAKDFKEQFNQVEGKPVNVSYGKQIFRNIILVDYNELNATVKTTMKGLLNTRAIKEIHLVESHSFEPQPEMLEFYKTYESVEAEVIEVEPKLPENWEDNGYFIIYGTFGANWKYAALKDRWGNVIVKDGREMKSSSSMKHSDLINWVYGLKNSMPEAPNYLLDDSYAAPQYFDISGTIIKQIK